MPSFIWPPTSTSSGISGIFYAANAAGRVALQPFVRDGDVVIQLDNHSAWIWDGITSTWVPFNNIAGQSHALLSDLSYAASGHTGFEPAQTKGSISETSSSVLTILNGLASTVGPNVTIQVKKADGSTSGYLSSTDWSTFNGKLTPNAPITPATKTKITYDANGLVTVGADAVASDISNDSSVSGSTVKDALNNLYSGATLQTDRYFVDGELGVDLTANGSIAKPFKTIQACLNYIGQPTSHIEAMRSIHIYISGNRSALPGFSPQTFDGCYQEDLTVPSRRITLIGYGVKVGDNGDSLPPIGGNILKEYSSSRRFGATSAECRPCLTCVGLENVRDSHQRLRNGFHVAGTCRTSILTRNLDSIQGDGVNHVTIHVAPGQFTYPITVTANYPTEPYIRIKVNGTTNYNFTYDITSQIDATTFVGTRVSGTSAITTLETSGSFFESDSSGASGLTHDAAFHNTYMQGQLTCDDGTVNGAATTAGTEVLYAVGSRFFTGMEGRTILWQRWEDNTVAGTSIVSSIAGVDNCSFAGAITLSTFTYGTDDMGWTNNRFNSAVPITVSSAAQTVRMDGVTYTSFLNNGCTWITNTPTVDFLDQDKAIKNTSTVSGTTVQDALNNLKSSASAGPGVEFFLVDTPIVSGPTIPTTLETLSKFPSVTGLVTDSVSATSGTSPLLIESYLYNTPLGGTQIDGGSWQFETWASTSATAGTNEVLTNVAKVVAQTGTVTMTTVSSTVRIVTSTGTPFVAGDANANPTLCSYIQTAGGIFPITTFTSSSIVRITVPAGYVNESAVAYSLHYKLFGVTTGSLTSTAITHYTTNVVQPSFPINSTDKLSAFYFATMTGGGTHTISYYHSSTTEYTHFSTPIITRHNDLAGLQGGAANEYYHLSASEFTRLANHVVQAAGLTISGGGAPISTGTKGYIQIPYSGVIKSWTLLADQVGSIVIDVWKVPYTSFPPTVANTITDSDKPTITAAQKNQNLAISTWTDVTVTANDIIAFHVDSASTITQVSLTLSIDRT
jgi:hypothetical protein